MRLYLGSDHAGFQLKQEIVDYLKEQGISFEDEGSFEIDPKDDYPDYALKVAKKVSNQKDSFGILFCGSSTGVCIVANKIKNIRGVAVIDEQQLKQSRSHNDANVLCLSGWYQSKEQAIKYINIFINTPFSNQERHIRRLDKIKQIENEN